MQSQGARNYSISRYYCLPIFFNAVIMLVSDSTKFSGMHCTMDSTITDVTIYTDGACSGNPGKGGYGSILKCGGKRKELRGGYRHTTNNRMEMLGAIVALKALKFPCRVKLYTDSKYMLDSITRGWAKKWQSNGWRKADKKRALNTDLWEELLELCDLHDIRMIWVKGHDGNIENERCDQLAVNAREQSQLLIDSAYEKQNPYNA